ncbi:cytochrome o ubiquinol oxidase subunit IV [Sphingomonas rubra]|uniref:Cytochrome bo(3) ubiquinol oxidase subunit 4 n=1 Tax=Sphingomonas rubra TaxID=634430 RepID=A0A1I5QUZ8_9SPHN|nr:cytochrome o ubiquinol oxidase subunit IV [Sphingomonas rubra]SFP49676.1 cytochrome o ubiquinol oxidase operon protein cyoD [Sphingomonas rubra]
MSSAADQAFHAAPDSHDDHGHDDHGGAPHGSRRGYVTGFLLSVVLTAIPFALVMTGVIADARITAGIVIAAAVVQIVVHMIYFLHMSTKSEEGWTMMALIFTIIVVVITISGSIWVMYNMNTNMMPGMGPDTATMTSGGM